MTTFFKKDKTSLVCGTTSEYTVLGSTNRFGPPDLDTRPPEMARSTIGLLVQRCPSCGFCAPEVSKGPRRAVQIVQSKKYLRQSSNPSYPELANRFLCWAFIQEALDRYADAGWAAVQAAWACDDANAQDAATLCRTKAVRLFRKVRTTGEAFAQGDGVEEAIMADLLRRSGRFDRVKALCRAGLKKNPEQMIQQILAFQLTLASQQDTGCHEMNEATKHSQKQ